MATIQWASRFAASVIFAYISGLLFCSVHVHEEGSVAEWSARRVRDLATLTTSWIFQTVATILNPRP